MTCKALKILYKENTVVVIIDYDAGNIKSVEKAVEYLGSDVVLSNDKKKIKSADRVILPGVGAFGDAMDNLKKYDLVETIRDYAKSGNPFLGICLGMQILFENSDEDKEAEGLSVIKGSIKKIPAKDSFKIPHMGWNNLNITDNNSRILKGIDSESYVYFVHSYYADACDKNDISATCDYTTTMDVVVERDNVFGCQFHPEKSSSTGLHILKNFLEIK